MSTPASGQPHHTELLPLKTQSYYYDDGQLKLREAFTRTYSTVHTTSLSLSLYLFLTRSLQVQFLLSGMRGDQ